MKLVWGIIVLLAISVISQFNGNTTSNIFEHSVTSADEMSILPTPGPTPTMQSVDHIPYLNGWGYESTDVESAGNCEWVDAATPWLEGSYPLGAVIKDHTCVCGPHPATGAIDCQFR